MSGVRDFAILFTVILLLSLIVYRHCMVGLYGIALYGNIEICIGILKQYGAIFFKIFNLLD